jgi:predicted HicB family RNase H-like nuclease
MPKTLHKELAAEAEEEGVSLNSLVVALLAQNYGRKID